MKWYILHVINSTWSISILNRKEHEINYVSIKLQQILKCGEINYIYYRI